MSVLDRSELEASPLADLHAIADQLGLDGFRRLRKAELIDAILGEPVEGQAGVDNREDSDESAKETPSDGPEGSSSSGEHRGRWRCSQTSRSSLRRGAKVERRERLLD